jgi:hypothetical protein
MDILFNHSYRVKPIGRVISTKRVNDELIIIIRRRKGEKMLGLWLQKTLICKECRCDVVFRVAFKKAQFYNGNRWEDIQASASIVLCPTCGSSIYIGSIKDAAEL